MVPTDQTLRLGPILTPAAGSVWGDLQHCVPFNGLSDSQMDSLFKQLQCHILYHSFGDVGGSFDLEAWRPDVSANEALDPVNARRHLCNWRLPDDAGKSFRGHIVQWAGDPKSQKTAWLVVADGSRSVRNWIPSSKIFYCLKAKGAPGPEALDEDFLSQYLPDMVGTAVSETAACGSGSTPGGTPVGGGGSPPSPPQTWSEQETPNHPVNTFTNYHNASGMGPAIAAGQWVQVSCKVYDPFIGSVNPDGYWYRIASSPWNNAYYSPANTFMNGDPYGGPYTHNTDFAVPNC
jgi:hypothetical protein